MMVLRAKIEVLEKESIMVGSIGCWIETSCGVVTIVDNFGGSRFDVSTLKDTCSGGSLVNHRRKSRTQARANVSSPAHSRSYRRLDMTTFATHPVVRCIKLSSDQSRCATHAREDLKCGTSWRVRRLQPISAMCWQDHTRMVKHRTLLWYHDKRATTH
jgi:hypothetical protein